MTPKLAATVWVLTDRVIKGVEKHHADAAKVLKEHFRKTGKTTYQGITYSETASTRLDTALARAALGPKKTAECTVESMRATLTRPAAATPITLPELDELLA